MKKIKASYRAKLRKPKTAPEPGRVEVYWGPDQSARKSGMTSPNTAGARKNTRERYVFKYDEEAKMRRRVEGNNDSL